VFEGFFSLNNALADILIKIKALHKITIKSINRIICGNNTFNPIDIEKTQVSKVQISRKTLENRTCIR
jgi:hypothetical protein